MAVLFSLLMWAVAAIIYASCSSPAKPVAKFVGIDGPEDAADPIFYPPYELKVPPTPHPAGITTGTIRELRGSTVCQSQIPLPYIITSGPPRVGEEWTCLFVTSISPPEPDWPMWIVTSQKPPNEGLPSPFGNGCWLLINPDAFTSILPGFEPLPGSLVTREQGFGRVTIQWTPGDGAAGQMLWVQLMVASPTGFVVSHAIEITVGS